MPKVGSRYSKYCFEEKTKNKLHLVLKKKTKNKKKQTKKPPKKTAELRFLGSISQTRRKSIYERWTTGAVRGGGRGALKLFYGKHVIAILKTCSTRLELRNYSRTYRNNAILPFDFTICQSEQFTMAIHLIFTHLTQMITDTHI